MITTLTVREREVATLVAEGLSNKQVARHLNLREGTVKIHLHKIFTKLAVQNRTVLAVMVLRVIEPGPSEDRKGGMAFDDGVPPRSGLAAVHRALAPQYLQPRALDEGAGD